jgi:hypothetical protein
MKAEKNSKQYKAMEPIAKWLSERTPEERDKIKFIPFFILYLIILKILLYLYQTKRLLI